MCFKGELGSQGSQLPVNHLLFFLGCLERNLKVLSVPLQEVLLFLQVQHFLFKLVKILFSLDGNFCPSSLRDLCIF